MLLGKIVAPILALSVLVLNGASFVASDESPAYLGVFLGEVSPPLAFHLGVDPSKAILITDISPDSPAQKAGITQFDVIVTLNENPVGHSVDFADAVRSSGAGKTVKLGLISAGQPKEVHVVLGEVPDSTGLRLLPDYEPGNEIPDLRQAPFGIPSVPHGSMPRLQMPFDEDLYVRLERLEAQHEQILMKLDELLKQKQ